jgi:hypothetical protein
LGENDEETPRFDGKNLEKLGTTVFFLLMLSFMIPPAGIQAGHGRPTSFSCGWTMKAEFGAWHGTSRGVAMGSPIAGWFRMEHPRGPMNMDDNWG